MVTFCHYNNGESLHMSKKVTTSKYNVDQNQVMHMGNSFSDPVDHEVMTNFNFNVCSYGCLRSLTRF